MQYLTQFITNRAESMKLESVSIKRTEGLNEKWVQDIIANDPAILGLGDLDLIYEIKPP